MSKQFLKLVKEKEEVVKLEDYSISIQIIQLNVVSYRKYLENLKVLLEVLKINFFKMVGISNGIPTIDAVVDFFENETDTDLKESFVSVFPSNYIIKFISFQEMAKEKTKKYPFIIMNTDRSDKSGTHWWSFLDLHEKKEIFLFDSFGFTGFKKFVINNDANILNKILFGIQKFEKKDQKITIISLKFSMKEYEKI